MNQQPNPKVERNENIPSQKNYINFRIQFSKKKNEFLIQTTAWTNLKTIVLN